MSSIPTDRPIAERPDALNSEIRALKGEVARLKKGTVWRTWWLLAHSIVTLALLGLIASNPGFMTRISDPGSGGPPSEPRKDDRSVAATKARGPSAPDQTDPDYGQTLLQSLQKRAKVKKTNAKGGTRWYNSLPRNEREAVLLLSLSEAVSAGDVEKVVRDGFGGEIRSLINTLENDVKTATARIVAENLRDLLPFIRSGSSFRASGKDVGPGGDWQGSEEERRDRVKRLNDDLKPLAPALRKDVDHLFYWRWKMEGETFWD